MPPLPDAISAKFADLQELRGAINNARDYLLENRESWMKFTTGTMTTSWADDAGLENQTRNSKWDTYGRENEDFLNRLSSAVDQAEQELRAAVMRARNAIASA